MIAQQLTYGIILGMIYALLAVGYSLVFGILRLLNMSHGSVYTFGAHMALMAVTLNWGLPAAFVFTVLATGILNVVINNVVLEPLRERNAPNITLLISVTGVSYIIQNGLMLTFGSSKMAFPKILNFGNITLGSVTITSTQLAILVVTIALFAILFLITNCTKMGLAMRCSSQNPKAARLMGIDVRKVVTFTFFLSGMCAAVAGYMIAGYYEMVYFTMGTTAGLKAFSAAVLGGIGVLYGSVAGGLIVGIAEAMATTFFGSNYAEAAAYIILFLVLVLRPSGLFGKDNLEKV